MMYIYTYSSTRIWFSDKYIVDYVVYDYDNYNDSDPTVYRYMLVVFGPFVPFFFKF